MKTNDDKIARLEEEISELPIGYISKKNINGKIRQYHQWTEDGKKKSKYLDSETALVVAERIAKRKELEKELKIEKALLPCRSTKRTGNSLLFKTNILISDNLKAFIQRAASLKSRPCLKQMQLFLDSGTQSRVFILYGLRRTGKTTLIQQAITSFNQSQFEKTVFIQISPEDTLSAVNHDMKILLEQGYKYVFIDEVTLLEDFIEGAAVFSDIYASSGMKIVLSGTDSLGFLFSSDDSLYDRCEMLHTTFIPYREFENVLGISGIDEYIRYGGTMSLSGINYNEHSIFSNKESTDAYVDSAIAKNIQHSLKYYQNAGHFRHLEDFYEKNELTSVINRVVEDINHRFTLSVLIDDFVSHDLGLSARNLLHDRNNPIDIFEHIDKKAFTESLRKALDILNKEEQTVEIKDAHRIEIKEYLDLLDLTVDVPVETIPIVNEKTYQTCVSQPGLRYSQAEALVKELMKDENFQSFSIVDRKHILDRILNEIKGRMMEEIVLLETKKAMKDKEVFKLKFAVGEFDMVIFDSENITSEIYEIKHSTEAFPDQYRHLVDEKKCRETEFQFGRIIRKCVIYRGENRREGEIEYLNVEEYLKGL